MNREFPQDSNTVESVEGTAAHDTAWMILRGEIPSPGATSANGSIVTEEMIEGGDLITETIKQRTAGMELHIEEKVDCVLVNPHCWGTPDVWGISKDFTRIEIFDYKFGHRFVDEFWNAQGLLYLAGILDFIQNHFRITPSQLEPVTTVSFTVVQPRCFHRGDPVRTHAYRLADTRDRFNHLANMAEMSMTDKPSATTNDHCGDCPGRHACSALQLAAYDAAEHSNARTPIMLSPTAAALELKLLMRALARLEARVDGLKEQTIANIRAGKPVPYFRAEPGYGRQQWSKPDSQIVAMGKMFGVDLAKPGVITPKQAEKVGVSADIVKTFSFVPSTGFKLVEDKSTDAAKTFAELREI